MVAPFPADAELTLSGKGTLHFGRYRDNAAIGEGSPYSASLDFQGRYVIRTVDFALTRIRRYDFCAQSRAICCAGLMSAVTFAAALRSPINSSPINDMAVIAGAFDHGAISCVWI